MTELVKLTYEALDKVCDWLDSLSVECEDGDVIRISIPYENMDLVLDFWRRNYWLEKHPESDTPVCYNLQLPERKRNEYTTINNPFPWNIMTMLNKWSLIKKAILRNVKTITDVKLQKKYLENFIA